MRACLVCGRPTSSGARCTTHRLPEPRNTYAYQKTRKQILAIATTCAICGERGTRYDPLTIDHITPVRDGGTNHPTNLRVAHRSCNSRRGTKTA
jgi:5-methylcytosine-specific restriction endonuclease McrA